MPRLLLAVPGAFTPAECDRIVALGEEGAATPGPVHGGTGYSVDRSRRDVRSTLVDRAEATAWLFDRLDALFATGAEELGLPVGPIAEPVQVLRYDVGGHFAAWHTDAAFDAHDRRRISMSVELSARDDYDGGELEVVPDLVGVMRTLPRGSAQLFPSQALHRVTPVTHGCRRSLVAWTGRPT